MKIARFDGNRLGIVEGDTIHDVTELVGVDPGDWPPVGMIRLVSAFGRLRPAFEETRRSRPGRPLTSVRLECPIDWPNKIIAFPANYHEHVAEMGAGLVSTFTATGQGFFLKATSSLSGPSDPIVLPPIPGREIHHESELAIVIGKGGRAIAAEAALDHVFGYACLIDAVVRGKEERVMRKSFDTFCPLGPYIVTADEVTDPADIDIALRVNGTLRQQANTRDLIVGIADMVAMASAVMTLYPGDVIASGTPAGVGPMHPGDRVDIEIAGVGSMSLLVRLGEQGMHPVWNKPTG